MTMAQSSMGSHVGGYGNDHSRGNIRHDGHTDSDSRANVARLRFTNHQHSMGSTANTSTENDPNNRGPLQIRRLPFGDNNKH